MENTVQSIQEQLATQFKQMQEMVHKKRSCNMLLHHSIPNKFMEAIYITVDTTIFADEKDAVPNLE